MSTYTQVLLEFSEPGRLVSEVAWVPTKFAEVGAELRVRRGGRRWQAGWFVRAVYATAPQERLIRQHGCLKDYDRVLGPHRSSAVPADSDENPS